MLNKYFYQKSPFVYNYFSNLLDLVKQKKRDFPQAIIFEGMDTNNSFLFSLELARLLNCKNNEDDCNCTNYKWIKSHQHPGINYISQIHSKPEGDETKTVISIKQAKEIEKNLMLSSDYHRFFIFFSSDRNDEVIENNAFMDLNYDNVDFSIEPLQHKTFHPTALNALLKSIEEPPKNTTFIFLVKSKEDILPTIVSRCLVFKMSSTYDNISYDDISDITSKLFNVTYDDAYENMDLLAEHIKNSSLEEILNKILLYLKDLILQKDNFENNDIYYNIQEKINIVNESIKYSRAKLSDKNVLENLFLKIAKGNLK